jgi:F-type H+-transporting ATPase subunit delta
LSRVSLRYAKALFSLALEEKKLNTIAADLDEIRSLAENNADFASFVVNPLISTAKQIELIREIFSGKVDKLTYNFLELICDKKRLNQLLYILNAFDDLVLNHRTPLNAEVTSAVALDDQQLDAIKSNLEALTSKSVILTTKEDSALIGGFKVLVGGVIIDNSVRYQLSKLKEKLVS